MSYRAVVPDIARSMRFDDKYFYAGVRFVMHTIRRQFHAVGPTNKLMSVHQEGLDWLYENKGWVRNAILRAESLEERLLIVMKIKGLNLAKSGFVLQLMGYEIGCVDSRNANIMGCDANKLVINKDRPLNRSLLWQYIGMCQSEEMGGAERMWDEWCDDLAKSYPDHFTDGNAVSVHHLNLIEEFYRLELLK